MRYANGWVDGEVEGKKQTKRKKKERKKKDKIKWRREVMREVSLWREWRGQCVKRKYKWKYKRIYRAPGLSGNG